MDITPVIPASELAKLQTDKKPLSKAVGGCIWFLEKMFGSRMMIGVPPYLQDTEIGSFQPIIIANKLRHLGIIKYATKRERFPDEPFAYKYSTQSNGRLHGSGIDFSSEESALWKSIAEATERYFWADSKEFYEKKIIYAPYGDLVGKAMNIFSLSGFTKEQKKENETLQFSKNTRFGWINAHSLISNSSVLCPVQLIGSSYQRENVQSPIASSEENKKKKEPMLRWPVTTGLATGRTIDEAVMKGLLEIIERDAFMITYLNRISPPRIDIEHLKSQDMELSGILDKFKRYDLEVHLIDLPTDFPVNVMTAIIIDRTGKGPSFSLGSSADFDLKRSILDSLSEAMVVRNHLKRIYKDPIDEENIGRIERLVYWAQPENLPKIEFLFKGEELKVNLNDYKNFYKPNENPLIFDKGKVKRRLATLKQSLKKLKQEACYVKISNSKVEALGLYCIQAVIPGLQPLHLIEKVPYFEGKRLKDIPIRFGYEPADKLNQEPHPFP